MNDESIGRGTRATAFDILDIVYWGEILSQTTSVKACARTYGHWPQTQLPAASHKPLKCCHLLRFWYAHWYYGRLLMKLRYSTTYFMPSPLHSGTPFLIHATPSPSVFSWLKNHTENSHVEAETRDLCSLKYSPKNLWYSNWWIAAVACLNLPHLPNLCYSVSTESICRPTIPIRGAYFCFHDLIIRSLIL